MKLYIDEITWRDLLNILIMIPKSLIDLVKEELFWWFVLYKYEIYYPVDWQKVCRKGLAESHRRQRCYQNAQNEREGG